MQDDLTRKGFWAALVAFILGLFGAGKVDAATKVNLDQLRSPVAGPGLVGYGPSRSGVPVMVGTGLAIVDGALNVTTVPVTVPTWVTAVLARDAQGNFPLPNGADGGSSELRVYVGALRYWMPEDFTIADGKIIPNCTPGQEDCNWSPDAVVRIEFQQV